MRIFVWTLGAVAGFVIWFSLGQDSSAAAASQRVTDLLDSRPTRTILIVGNSRTYFNHMPAMLREIADSAGSPTKFQVETSAYGGATFKTHWSVGRTRRLLAVSWDEVILQPESGAQTWRKGNEEFLLYGPRLAAAARPRQGRPRLVVGWPYDAELYREPDLEAVGFGRSEHLALIREMHAKLASEASLSKINVAGPWEAVRLSYPWIRLTSDGNHPTVAGSYLYALAVYAHLSNSPVARVTYVPDGVSPEDAKAIREAVDSIPLMS